MSKKNNTRTVNVDAVKRDVKKLVQETESKSVNKNKAQQFNRQSVLEQEMGTSKYRQMIHDHNKNKSDFLDKLPFTFPKKRPVRSSQTVVVFCVDCSTPHAGSEHTIGLICSSCKKYVRVTNEERDNLFE